VGIAATVEWSGDALTHLWFWHEHHGARLLNDWPITCLGLEPSSTVHGSGLADAIESGEAIVLPPGAMTSTETVVTVE
jgi:hypothetical protein